MAQLLAARAWPGFTNANGASALLLAAKNGHATVVGLLLAAGAPVDKAENTQLTPLIAAANEGHELVAQQLLAAGASVNDANRHSQMTPLMFAAGQGHQEVAQQLLAAGATVDAVDRSGCTPLMYAAWQGHCGVVRRLLAAGAAVNRACPSGATALLGAARAGHAEVVQLLLEAGAAANAKDPDTGGTALHMAARAGLDAMARHLVAAPGVDLDSRYCDNQVLPGCSRILWALIADRDCPASLTAWALLSCAAAAILPPYLALAHDLTAQHSAPIAALLQTPLHIAAWCNASGVAEVLLAAGAAVDAADDDGHTPLHFAAGYGNGRIVQHLLAAGAEKEAQTVYGNWTPLHYAAREGAVGPVGLLAGAGADLHAVASDGSRPLHLAAGPACLEAARLLLRLGASPSLKDSRGVSALKAAAAGSASAASALRAETAAQRRCAACGSEEGRLQRCARCQAAVYYSPTCQRQHWPQHKQHKQRCKPLAQPPAP